MRKLKDLAIELDELLNCELNRCQVNAIRASKVLWLDRNIDHFIVFGKGRIIAASGNKIEGKHAWLELRNSIIDPTWIHLEKIGWDFDKAKYTTWKRYRASQWLETMFLPQLNGKNDQFRLLD